MRASSSSYDMLSRNDAGKVAHGRAVAGFAGECSGRDGALGPRTQRRRADVADAIYAYLRVLSVHVVIHFAPKPRYARKRERKGEKGQSAVRKGTPAGSWTRFVCGITCIYIYIHTHTDTHTHTYTFIYIRKHIGIYTHIHIYIYTYIHTHIYTYTYTYTYVCVCVCVCVCVYSYIHIFMNSYMYS
jgi:hypothetical protein